jgi:hypothetical protein
MGIYAINLCIKGPACQALDAISSNTAAMTQLQAALAAISGADFAGLEDVLATNLLPASFSANAIIKLKAQLKSNWFDPNSPSPYFPGLNVAGPYGLGLMKTLELALKSHLPIDSWWLPNHTEIDMLNLVSPRQVTLIIATPQPAAQAAGQAATQPAATTIGFSTRLVAGRVETREINIISR